MSFKNPDKLKKNKKPGEKIQAQLKLNARKSSIKKPIIEKTEKPQAKAPTKPS